MVSLGAMYSQERAKVLWMTCLLDVMEAYVFSWPGRRDDDGGFFTLAEAPDEETLDYQFQLFQGAYMMVVVQYFSGNLAARRRARRRRFTTVLSVRITIPKRFIADPPQIARSFRLPIAQHDSVVAIPDEVAFQRWVRQEVRIRRTVVLHALEGHFI